MGLLSNCVCWFVCVYEFNCLCVCLCVCVFVVNWCVNVSAIVKVCAYLCRVCEQDFLWFFFLLFCASVVSLFVSVFFCVSVLCVCAFVFSVLFM